MMRLNDQFKKSELNIYLEDESGTEGYIKDMQAKYPNQIISFIEMLFRVLGVMKLGFVIPVPMLIITAIAMIIVSFLIAFGLCGRIRKISAYELISE